MANAAQQVRWKSPRILREFAALAIATLSLWALFILLAP
jgi:hypothetical protein